MIKLLLWLEHSGAGLGYVRDRGNWNGQILISYADSSWWFALCDYCRVNNIVFKTRQCQGTEYDLQNRSGFWIEFDQL